MGLVGKLPALWRGWGSEGVVGTPLCSWDWGWHLKLGGLVGRSCDLGVCPDSRVSVRRGLRPRPSGLCRMSGDWASGDPQVMLLARNEDVDLLVCVKCRLLTDGHDPHLLGLGEHDKHMGAAFSVHAGRHQHPGGGQGRGGGGRPGRTHYGIFVISLVLDIVGGK